jgi:hypothetical protein
MQLRAALLVVPLAACAAPAKPAATTPPSNTEPTPAATRTVHDVDWLNRTYTVDSFGEKATYTVVEGEATFAYDQDGNEVGPDYEPPPDGYVERGWFQVAPAEFGDLTGDGVDEALVLSALNTGGTGVFDGVDVYGMKGDQPVVIGHIPGGDRGDGGLAGALISGRDVLVERMMSQDGDGACCPSKVQYEIWQWRDGALVEDQSARRLEDLPSYDDLPGDEGAP